MRVCGVLVLAALAAAAQDAIGVSAGAVTCPVMVQSQTTSTLTDPITKVVSSSGSGDSSSSSSDSSSRSGSTSSSMDGSAGASSTDVGNSDGSSGVSTGSTDGASTGSVGGGSAGSAGVATGSSSTGTTPSSTTATPSSTTKTPSTTTTTPSTTTATPSTTTATPTTPGSSTGSATGSSDSAGTTRRLQTTTTTGTVSAGSTTGTTTTTTSPSTTGSSSTGTTTPSPGTTTTSSSTGSGSVGSSAGSSSTSTSDDDVMTCDSTFYSQWDTFGLTCGGSSLDVDSAVAASSCVIYSGSVGSTSGSTCVSICSFPACTNSAWVYGADNGLASSVYDGLELDSFMNSTIIAALEERSSTVSTFLSNSTMTSDEQCSYSSESSFSSCTCSAMLVSSSNATDAEKKQQREQDEADGVITKDNTTTSGTVVATTSKSIAGVTVVVSSIAAIASTVAGTTSTATASVAMAGANAAVTTVELCQFAVFINQLDLDGKSSALSLFGKQMAPANFMFLPFGKFDEDEEDDGSSSGSGSEESSSSSSSSSSESSTRRRLSSDSGSSGSSSSSSLTGIAKYARQIGIKESMLFIVTLAGVICVMAGVVALFGIGYVVAGFFMPREEFLTKFFDKMIGLEILVAILSQYTIGVTGTYQIYYSFKNDDPTDPKCILAMVALLGLACGIILYGYVVVKKHEAEIADVGTVQHLKKTVNMRYGPFYEEYKYKNRFFFTAKMFVALATGVVTGFVGISSTIQVSIVLGINVIFFFYLEIQAPHHSKFVQTATSFVSIMKIAVLVLTFFLISAAASDGFPTELQNGISLAIVGLNLFALVLLMIRSLYMFWKKYQLQREARFDDEEQTAQDYFKDETPQQAKDRQLTNATHQVGGLQPQQSQQSLNPYVQGNQAYDYDNNGDEIRLRSGTHMQEQVEVGNYQQQQQVGEYQQQAVPQQTYDVNRHTAANYYANDPRASAAHRRNDVVEL